MNYNGKKRRMPGLWAARVAAAFAVAYLIFVYINIWSSSATPLMPGLFLFVFLPVLCIPPLLAHDAISLRRLYIYSSFTLVTAGLSLGLSVLPSLIFMVIAAITGYIRREPRAA